MDARRLLMRYTVCKVANHAWAKVDGPGAEGGPPFLRCRRCGKERHEASGIGQGYFIGGA